MGRAGRTSSRISFRNLHVHISIEAGGRETGYFLPAPDAGINQTPPVKKENRIRKNHHADDKLMTHDKRQLRPCAQARVYAPVDFPAFLLSRDGRSFFMPLSGRVSAFKGKGLPPYGTIKTEVILMHHNRSALYQALWLLALTIPWPLAGTFVHTPASLMIGISAYWGMGLLVPFLFYLFQQRGWGSEPGAIRAAVHLPLWISVVLAQIAVFYNYLPRIQGSLRENFLPVTIGAFFILSFCILGAAFLDRMLAILYGRLKEKGGLWAKWLGSACLTGLIPGTAIISFLGLFYTGGMRLDPFMASVFLMEIFNIIFYAKIFLAMMTFGLFVFFAGEGKKSGRITNSVFSAIFWMFLLFIPIVISDRITSTGAWRSYFDPSYISMFPYLSDLWLTGLALMGGERITKWIFRE